MTDAWYSACLGEVETFLDSFQEKDARLVRIDSDLVAALVGLLQGAAIQRSAFLHMVIAGQELERLV